MPKFPDTSREVDPGADAKDSNTAEITLVWAQRREGQRERMECKEMQMRRNSKGEKKGGRTESNYRKFWPVSKRLIESRLGSRKAKKCR